MFGLKGLIPRPGAEGFLHQKDNEGAFAGEASITFLLTVYYNPVIFVV
jgi:hypothetical protein